MQGPQHVEEVESLNRLRQTRCVEQLKTQIIQQLDSLGKTDQQMQASVNQSSYQNAGLIKFASVWM